MAAEECGVCGRRVPFDDTVHVLVHTHGETGVIDRYVCRRCYEAELAPALEGDAAEAAGEPEGDA